MSLLISGDLRLRRTWQPMDPDAAAYIDAVEAADTQALEERTKIAIDNFVLGCKADGIWPAIKASCILAGARTLSGALVPLVGTAPTNVNFVSGDYNRKTGLVGNGSSKYLDSNRNNNADPQNNMHVSVYETLTHNNGATFGASIGTNDSPSSSISQIAYRASNDTLALRAKDFNNASQVRANSTVGFTGNSRSISSSFAFRFNNTNGSISATSNPPATANYLVFAQNIAGTGAATYSNGRLAFYSIGESLDLALLDTRVTTLINAFAAAIP